MTNSIADSRWSCLNTKEDLLKLFTGHVDVDVIEMVVESRNNDLLLAYRDLIEITTIPDPEKSLNLPCTEGIKQSTAASNNFNTPEINWERLSTTETPINKILYLVSNGYRVMVLMRGCPGSGKSFQATNILNLCYKNANINDFIFSADQFFINKRNGKYCFNHSKLSDAHDWAFKKFQTAIELDITPVIIDNTNCEAWEMEQYVKVAVNNGYWIEIIEPNTEWAWDAMELFKKCVHSVPYDIIIHRLHKYDHTININNLLTRFNCKYNKKTQPPILSNSSKKYQICDNLLDQSDIVHESQIEFNDNFKDMCVTQKVKKKKKKKKIDTSLKSNDDEHPLVTTSSMKQEKEDTPKANESENLSLDIVEIDEESECSTEEASNNADKSVNTYENDFLFMEVLNEIPQEEYSSYVVFGSNRNINHGNLTVLNMSCGKLDKGTMTNDLRGIIPKLDTHKLCEQFPEDISTLIIELFDQCEGNIDWVVDMLVESKYDISKQQLCHFIEYEENDFTKNVQRQDSIELLKQDISLLDSPLNSQSKTVNRTNEETNGKKKKLGKKIIDKKLQTTVKNIDDDIRKDIENKFVFGDSLYSDHVLKIKKLKENQNTVDCSNFDLPRSESVEEDLMLEQNDAGNFVQLVMDRNVLAQLCDYFGDFSPNFNQNTLLMPVKLPEKLAEELYYYLIANAPIDVCNQDAILQDETLARILQGESTEECSPNSSNSYIGEFTFSAVLTKKLLLEKFKNFPSTHVLNVLRAKNYKFHEANECLSEASGIKCSLNQDNPTIQESEKSRADVVGFKESDDHKDYSQLVLELSLKRQQLMQKANQSLSTKQHPSVTAHYLERAEIVKQDEIYAKTRAVIDLVQQKENATSLDLHNLTVPDAIIALNIFLDNHISNLKRSTGGNRGRQLTIITGRGKHSPKGIARIKPVVLKRLQDRRLMYLEPEIPGTVMVIIKKNSLLGSEF